MRVVIAVWVVLCALTQVLHAQRLVSYDVVVIGATPAGIAAAIVAGRSHLSVALVGESPVPGGLLSSGVSRSDDAMVQSVSGVFEDFQQRIAHYYLTRYPNDPVVKADLLKPPIRHNAALGEAWEPKVAANTYRQMLAEVPSIHTYYRELPIGVKVDGKRVVAVETKDRYGSEHLYRGRTIIDATYEGDVAAFAGVPYAVGREPRTPEEPHAGVIYTDAFCEGTHGLPGAILPGSTGRGDKKIMSYEYRLTLKDYGKAEGPWRIKTPPPGYDPQHYKWSPAKLDLPDGKLDLMQINWGNDLDGPNYAYPEANWEKRSKIDAIYRNYALGFLYYIQTVGKQPNLGLANDEYTDNGNFPYLLYVREARRIDGLYRLTESDIHKDLRGNGLRGPLHGDSVAIGLYEMDSHDVENPTNRASRCSGEGAFNLVNVTGPYEIPYGVMVPKNRDGLIVPVAISATHVAMASVRMEPVWSALGEAAGTAAVLAIATGKPFRDLPVEKIQEQLLNQGQKLFFYQDVSKKTPHFAAIEKMSLKGAVDGDENYRFHPDSPITLGELSRLLVVGLDIPISITASHFRDAPRGSRYFKYIETLYDASSESNHPFLPFEVRKYLIYRAYEPSRAYVYPNTPVSRQVFDDLVKGMLRYREQPGVQKSPTWRPAAGIPGSVVTRGEACEEISRLFPSIVQASHETDRTTTSNSLQEKKKLGGQL